MLENDLTKTGKRQADEADPMVWKNSWVEMDKRLGDLASEASPLGHTVECSRRLDLPADKAQRIKRSLKGYRNPGRQKHFREAKRRFELNDYF